MSIYTILYFIIKIVVLVATIMIVSSKKFPEAFIMLIGQIIIVFVGFYYLFGRIFIRIIENLQLLRVINKTANIFNIIGMIVFAVGLLLVALKIKSSFNK